MKFDCDENERKSIISKPDLILFVIIIVIALVVILFFKLNTKKGFNVQISIDGKVVENFSIEDDREYQVNTENGENLVIIENGQVRVSYADCPDKVCVNHVPIKSVGEVIICLPHKLVVEVVE